MRFKLLMISVGMSLLAGCAVDLKMNRGTIVPAAMAKGKAKLDDNNNGTFHLTVERLAPPKNLTPPQRAYVVWAQTQEGKTQLLGTLKVDSDGEGEFNGTVPHKRFRVLVTAEQGLSPSQPSNVAVFTSEYVALGD